jgi:uncharacterized protein (DUF58 family)
MVITALGFTIFVMALIGTFLGGYAVLGVTLILAILAALWYWRKKRHRSLTSLLPTSAEQAGDASDIHSAPDANAPACTLDQGREDRGVLRQPPPAVMRGRDNRGSYLGRPVTMVMGISIIVGPTWDSR